MTNLTSEQYRDVIKHVQNFTEEVPSVQYLLRKAVETFYNRFRAYPDMAGVAPGKIGIFGDQTQFDSGLALPTATQMVTIMVGRKVPGKHCTVVTSADVGKPHKVKFSFSRHRPLAPGCPDWLNHVKGVVDNYNGKVPNFEAAIETTVPMGVGFGSSSAIQVATYSFLEVLVGKKADPIEKAKACQKAHREFLGKEVGLVDRITSILAKDRHAMLIDCQTNEVKPVPLYNKKATFVAVDPHLKDTLYGDEYSERGKYIKKACELLGVETLKNCTEEDLERLENTVNIKIQELEEEEEEQEEEEEEEEEEKDEEEEGEEKENNNREREVWTKEDYVVLMKRAKFFITEMIRIREAVQAWKEGEIEIFGEKMKESHQSLKEDFDLNNPALDFLVNTSLEVKGVMGSRMTGMGLGSGGGVISVMTKENVARYCQYVRDKFVELEDQLTEELKAAKIKEKEKRKEIEKKILMEAMRMQKEIEERKEPPMRCQDNQPCRNKRTPCIVKVERKSRCGKCGVIHQDKDELEKENAKALMLAGNIGGLVTAAAIIGAQATSAVLGATREKNAGVAGVRSGTADKSNSRIGDKFDTLMTGDKSDMESGKPTPGVGGQQFGADSKIISEEGVGKNGTATGDKFGDKSGAKGGNGRGTVKGLPTIAGKTASNLSEIVEGGKFSDENEITSSASSISAISDVKLTPPSFYVVSPFAGTRMMLVTKTDLLRSMFARSVPHPKVLVKSAIEELKSHYGTKPEAIGMAPATATLFGEFMEFHLGCIICMALPMMVATVGGRNDSVLFSLKTMSKDVEEPTDMKYPLPCVRELEMEPRTWVNYVLGTVNEFKGHVPGFNAVINSSVPLQIGVNSCSALQASLYTFLESLTRECTSDAFEKADRCAKSEFDFLPGASELVTRCSFIKFFPTFLSKEGHLMFIDCKKYSITHHFFDHPSYVFLIATCRENTTDVTVETLDGRLKKCLEALEILGKNSLLDAELKHLRCLKKRDVDDETIRRARYIITERLRTQEALKAIKEEDYRRLGLLMTQSHASLRDDYQVSSPQIENLIKLARDCEGVLGAKMLGKGMSATIIILIKLSEVDKCIHYMRKKYNPKSDKPNFYITKPSQGAYIIEPTVELPYIP